MPRSTFAGFNASVSGLFAAQRSLDVIGHNIANQNTEGYTRQRSNQVTADPTSIENGRWLGTGVKMDNIVQIRDELLDIKFRTENGKKGYWEEAHTILSQVENIFGEPKSNGITSTLNNFFASMDEVIKNSEDPTAKQNFVENSLTLTRYLNTTISRFEKLISDTDEYVAATINKINNNLEQIANLNTKILEAEYGGGMANDLRDRRNLLLDELSEVAEIRINRPVYIDKDGRKSETLQVEIAGHTVVNHEKVSKIELREKQDHPLYEVAQKYDNPKSEDLKNLKVTRAVWGDGERIDMNKVGGKLGSLLRQRDSFGDPAMNNDVRGIPYYVRVINTFTKSFAKKVNEVHRNGIDRNGEQGKDFFEISGVSSILDARNITVNADIVNNLGKLAIGLSKDESDNRNFLAMYNLRNSGLKMQIKQKDYPNTGSPEKTLDFGTGRPEDLVKSLISATLGVDAKEANDAYNVEVSLVLEADTARMEVTSVSENEELTNMIKFQHAYNASARMITTVDEMIDVIINRMGRVGL